MSDSIETLNKIWDMLVDYGIKSFEYKSDNSGECIKVVFENAQHQELQLYSLIKQQSGENV